MFIYNKEQKLDSILFMIMTVFVFIYGLMFPILNQNAVLLVLALYVGYGIYREKKFLMDYNLLFLMMACAAIAAVDYHAGETYSFMYGVLWILSYLCGKYIIGNSDNKSRNAFIICFSMALGLMIQGFLNYYNGYKIITNGGEYEWASFPEYWTGIEVSRSLYAFDFIIMSSLLIFALLLLKNNRALSCCIILCALLIVIVEMTLGKGRFSACVEILTCLLFGTIYLLRNKQSIPKRVIGVIKYFAITLVGIVAILVLVIKLNIAEIGNIYSNSFLVRDGGILRNIRFQSIAEGIQLSIEQPQGGWNVPSIWGGASHNVWLLIGRGYDSFIMMLLLIFFLFTLKDFVVLLKRKQLNKYDYALLSVWLGVNVYYMLETGPFRYRLYWLFLLMIDGMLKRISCTEDIDMVG